MTTEESKAVEEFTMVDESSSPNLDEKIDTMIEEVKTKAIHKACFAVLHKALNASIYILTCMQERLHAIENKYKKE